MMTTTSAPDPVRPAASARRQGESGDSTWSQPVSDPGRNALLASASAKLSETALRIESLKVRLEALTTQAAATSLS